MVVSAPHIVMVRQLLPGLLKRVVIGKRVEQRHLTLRGGYFQRARPFRFFSRIRLEGKWTMSRFTLMWLVHFLAFGPITFIFIGEANGQLVWNQEMDKYSAILPLTLDNNVYRVRAKPPKDVTPQEINCEIGITGTVLTDQRGTSAVEPAEKVLSSLQEYDDIDVQFTDRVYTGNRDYAGNRIIEKYDFDCGINVKYQTKLKIAQLEIRVGYVLPSGDVEGLTWSKIRRKQRIYRSNIAKCGIQRREIADLQAQCSHLASSAGNHVERTVNYAKIASLERSIDRKQKFVAREDQFKRDLAAFASLDEYLKTKIHGCHVYVHFHHNGKTLAVDLDELKRSRVRPIQVFEPSRDPVLTR